MKEKIVTGPKIIKACILILFLSMLLPACLAEKQLLEITSFKGIIKTCILDSTSLTKEPSVKIIATQTFINYDCPAKPESYDSPMTWPSAVYFDFETNKYTFQYSPVALDNNLAFTDADFKMSWNVDVGSLSYNTRKKAITLTSAKYKWKRTFKMLYSANKDTLLLTALK